MTDSPTTSSPPPTRRSGRRGRTGTELTDTMPADTRLTDDASAQGHAEPVASPDSAARRIADRVALPALSLGSGALVALSLPPWGWWPLAIVGIALYVTVAERLAAEGARRRRRFGHAWLFGAGWMYLGMGWMVQLTIPGYLAACAIFGVYHGVAALIVRPGPNSLFVRPAAHALAEALRFAFPFGGVPLASLGISQVGGPLAGVARIGGVVLLTWLTLQLGALVAVAAARLADRRKRHPDTAPRTLRPIATVASGLSAAVVTAALTIAPDTRATGDTIEVAAVQGGGEQGTTALDVESDVVTQRHLDATAAIPAERANTLDLVFWPENTIDTEPGEPFLEAPERDAVAAEAARLGVPLAVGITEPFTERRPRRYTNAHVVVTPDGDVTSRYDKVRRVPFGEYVPLRTVLRAITSEVDRVGAAVAGTDPAVLDLPTGERFATVISWEVFFGGRAREGVKLGATAILNPTNGASYTGTIVQTQQVASSRLRAIETGRWVVQAAPTGYTAFIDHTGEVRQRSDQSERVVLYDTVELRTGNTWYTSLGDGPFIAMLLVVIAAGLTPAVVRTRRSDD
ncbi:MAG: apolipoprotein N-acyltransferase [Actinomycetota bacterium]